MFAVDSGRHDMGPANAAGNVGARPDPDPALLTIAILGLFAPVIIVWWKGRPIMPIAVLSLAFWPGALILALQLRCRPDS